MDIFDYDNVLLLPRKCRVQSRSECDPSVELGGRRFLLPVVPANMKTVVDEKICLWLARNGYFYVMHRFDLDNVKFVRMMKELLNEFEDLQIVATTHSPYVLDELDPSDVHVFALRDDGSVAGKRLSEHPEAEKTKGSLTAGQLWSLDRERDWVLG